MFFTYLRRELANRRKQTVIIATGMSLAIALVVVVNSLSAGIQSAQATALESIYGVGTDITVTQAATPPSQDSSADAAPSRGQTFDFAQGEGTTSGGTTTVSKSRLSADRGTTTFDDTALDTVSSVRGVSGAAATLNLTNSTFSGQMPERTSSSSSGSSTAAKAPTETGSGGSSFNVDSFTVLGVDPTATAVGPLSSVTLVDGETLTTNNSDDYVAVLDQNYATANSLAVGDTIDIGGTTFTIIGTVTSSTTSGSSTAADVYISLATAQALSGETGKISTIYVQADNSNDIDSIASAISGQLSDLTVTTDSQLASSVSGSLGTAASLVSNLGTWLSIIVLVAAIAIAVLFTISGVTRRTREFGTLKAIGWSNRGIVRQVAGESFVQSLIGGVVGAVIGVAAVLIINMFGIKLSSSTSVSSSAREAARGAAGGGAFGPGSGSGTGGMASATSTATDITLNAPVSVQIILVAILLAALGGLVAGAFGGWRAARLRPAEALRAIA